MNAFSSHAPQVDRTVTVIGALVTVTLRLIAWPLFLLLSLAEPFLAVILGALALGCFFVSVFFGFILHAPFQHRWFVLGASVFFLGLYVLFRFLLLGVSRFLR